MRNLVPLRRAAWRLPSDDANHNDQDQLRFCVSASEQLVYLLDARSGRIDALPIDDVTAQPELLVELGAAILTADDARWQWIEYVAELDAVVCGSTGGALAVVDLQTRDPEEIGSLDGGLVGMAWSSNQETLALATGVGTLVVMNTQWEVLHETQLQAHLPPGVTLVETAGVSMAWRDDAKYLVLNVAVTEGAKTVRKVLVFAQELELHALGRLEDGRAIPHLGDSVDWCPNHSLIASHEARKEQLFIVFFERNGLRHGEFALPPEYRASTTSIKKVQWNIQSDVIAVHAESTDGLSRLLLWTRNNYHWYLKQELAFDHAGDQSYLRSFHWDDERSTLLHLLLAPRDDRGSSRYEQVEFAWDVTCGVRRLDNEQSSVVNAVIDGRKLLLTPVHQALVPPPMALHTLTFEAPVNSVAFDAFHDTLVVALSTGKIVLVTNFLAAEDAPSSSRVFQQIHSDASVNSVLFLRRIDDGDTVVVATKNGSDDALAVWAVTVQLEYVEDLKILIPSEDVTGVRRACEVVAVEGNEIASRNEFALQTDLGRILCVKVDNDTAEVSPLVAEAGQPIFSRLEIIRLPEDRHLVVGVSSTNSKLLVDGIQVTAAACSSFTFCAFSSVLLYTTLGSAAELRLVPLAALESKSFSDNEESRVIERGARLVAVVGDRASVILQMPRGNLEGTSPRLLVLALTVKLIDRLEYAKALEMGRRHRLDLNLLVDYDSTTFLHHFAEHLVDSFLLKRPAAVTSDRLCLFITNLHVVDVWKTKYGPLLAPFLTAPHIDDAIDALAGEEKVNRVCQAMMRALQERGTSHSDALLLPFLTAAVKQSPPDFNAALSQLQQLVVSSRTSTESAASAKRAMKHLIFLTQVDMLFDEALGMYDISLVRFIAGYSQRDPKEYMPFLDECEAVGDEVIRRYNIDVRLKRFSKALAHVSELLQRDDVDPQLAEQYESKVAELVVEGSLYEQALALFLRSSTNAVVQRLHRQILQLKAEFLVAQSRFEDAGFLYLTIDNYSEAMQAFKNARAWRMALSTASRAKLDPLKELRVFAYEVAQALVNQNNVPMDDVLAAASIYAEYCDDVDEAVALLVAHKQWSESVRVALLHKRPDLVETDVETGVAVALDALCDDITQRQHDYVVHWKRLTTIREQKRLFKLHGIDGSRWEDGARGPDDAQSVVSGAASSAAASALSAASSLRSVGSHNSAMRGIGNFSTKSLAAATSSHFYATQSMGGADAISAAAAAYKAKRYGGMPSRAERRRRITEGSAEEEAHVAKQLRASAPSAALLRETRDVLRALVVFGHTHKAQALQQQLTAFEATVRDEFPLPADVAETPEDKQVRPESEAEAHLDDVTWRFPAFL